jgi:hypothetical protein
MTNLGNKTESTLWTGAHRGARVDGWLLIYTTETPKECPLAAYPAKLTFGQWILAGNLPCFEIVRTVLRGGVLDGHAIAYVIESPDPQLILRGKSVSIFHSEVLPQPVVAMALLKLA